MGNKAFRINRERGIIGFGQFCSRLLQNWRLAIPSLLFPIAWLLPQRLYLRAELVDDLLEILDCGQLILDRRRQFAGYPISGHADRLIDVLESKLHNGAAPALA